MTLNNNALMKVREAFDRVNMWTPDTVGEWKIEYARDVVDILINFQLYFASDPMEDRAKLHHVLSMMGVYGPVEEMK